MADPIQEHQDYSSKVDHVKLIIFCIISAVVMVFEGWIIKSLENGSIEFITAIGMHFAVIFLLGLWVLFKNFMKDDIKAPVLLILTVGVIGPYGAAICIVAILLFFIYTRTAEGFLDWFKSMFPDEDINETHIYERLEHGYDDLSEKHSITPFADVIALGTEDQKRVAIAKMTLHFSPQFAGALLAALNDASNPIRVQAATALAKIEHDFSKRLIKMEKDLEKRPDNLSLLLSLARNYDAYAHCGLLDEEREAIIRGKAVYFYEKYLKLRPASKTNPLILGRLYLSDRQPEKIHKMLKREIDKKRKPAAHIVMWYMESLFQLGKFAELRKFCKDNYEKFQDRDAKFMAVFEFMKLWSSDMSDEEMKVMAVEN